MSVSSTYDEGRNARSSRPSPCGPKAAVSTDRLVDELWGEDAPKTAKHALENYVSQLRKTLGSEVISTRPSGYALELDPARVDVAGSSSSFGRRGGAGTEQRAELLGLALSLVRGPPLADLVLEPFAPAEIRRLEELELPGRSWSTRSSSSDGTRRS